MIAAISENNKESCSSFSNYFFDDCVAFIEQVPESFDLGTVEVRLSCMTASSNYFAIGSQCGALFLFNRKICQSVRPLRTSYDEIITCLSVFSRDNGMEYLAVGHRSGTLIVLYLPTSHPNGTRKLKQSILDDVHTGFAVHCLDWSSDGTKLFSADSSGQIMMTHVDFENNEFINTTVCEEREVLYLKSSGEFLAIATDYFYKIVNISNNCVVVVQRYLEGNFSRISGIAFQNFSDQLLILLRNGDILAHNLHTSSGPFKFKDLNKIFENVEIPSRTCCTNSSPRKNLTANNSFDVEDFLSGRVKSFFDGRLLIYYTKNHFLLCRFETRGSSNILVKTETFNLYELFDNVKISNGLEIVDLVCNGNNELIELFILASNQRVYRLSTLPAIPALLQSDSMIPPVHYSAPSMGVLFNSLSTVAQKSSKNLFDRFQTTGGSSAGRGSGVSRFIDNFLTGGSPTGQADVQSDQSVASSSNREDASFSSENNLQEQTSNAVTIEDGSREITTNCLKYENSKEMDSKLVSLSNGATLSESIGSPDSGFKFLSSLHPKSLRLSEEYSTKISVNLQNIFQHLKNTNILTDFDSQSSMRDRVKEDPISEMSSSIVTSELDNLTPDLVDESNQLTAGQPLHRTVTVSRRKKTKIAKRNSLQLSNHSDQDSSHLLNQISISSQQPIAVSGTVRSGFADTTDISNIDLDRILGVIGLAEPTLAATQDTASNSALSHTVDDSVPLEMTTNDDIDQSQAEGSNGSDADEQESELECDVFVNEQRVLPSPSQGGDLGTTEEERYTSLEDVIRENQFMASTSTDEKSTCNRIIVEPMNSWLMDCDNSMRQITEVAEPDALFNSDDDTDRQWKPSNRSTVSSNVPRKKLSSSDYSRIAASIDEDAGVSGWSVLPPPPFGSLGTFDASADCVIACPPSPSAVLPALFRRLRGRPSNAAQRPYILRMDGAAETYSNGVSTELWQPFDRNGHYATSSVAVNDSGSITWRIVDGVVFMAKSPLIECMNPNADVKWAVQTGDAEGHVTQIAMTARTAWYLAKNGVFVQMKLPEMGIFYRAECPFQLKELTASESAVWALNTANGNLVIRSGLRHCPMGVDWIEDSTGHGLRFVSVALYGHFGFGLDRLGQLWMNDSVTKDTPFGAGVWPKMESFDFAISALIADSSKRHLIGTRDKWRLRVTSKRLFVSLGADGLILTATVPIYAHSMACPVPRRLTIYNRFELIAATGYGGEVNDIIYVISKSDCREVFAYSVDHNNFVSLPPISQTISASFRAHRQRRKGEDGPINAFVDAEPPADETLFLEALRRQIVAISACRERVVVVDDAGESLVYSLASDLMSTCFESLTGDFKRDWSCLQRPTVNGLLVKLVSIAVSSVALWTVDTTGRIFYAPTQTNQISDYNFVANWTLIPSPSPTLSKINEVRTSPKTGLHVLVFDSLAGECWTRASITQDNPSGTDWIKFDTSIRVDDLAVGEDGVWALSPLDAESQRTLYKLIGQTPNCPIGQSWTAIMSTRLGRISIDTAAGRIWGLEHDGRLIRHEMKMYGTYKRHESDSKKFPPHSDMDEDTSACSND